MKSLTNNQLLLGTLVAVSLYFVAGLIVPNPYVSSATSLMLLICGGLVLYRYIPITYDIVVHGRKSTEPGEERSHLAVYGTALLAAGSCYVGLFGLLWIYFDQPGHWLGTAYSGFGRAMMACGFWLMYVSPDTAKAERGIPQKLWFVVIMAFALIMAFLLGTQVKAPESAEIFKGSFGRIDLPQCPKDRQIWAATGSNIYHDLNSPYRGLVHPDRCFATPQEAEIAGYRAPKVKTYP